MNISIQASHYPELTGAGRQAIEEKLAPVARLLGSSAETALLVVEVEHAAAEGRSAEPCRLVANLTDGSHVYHAEAVKPTPESAADRVRSTLEAEVRRVRGKERGMWKRGGGALKRMLRFGR